eukprot:1312583-Amorphochlora_amoeboformis.AAC.1
MEGQIFMHRLQLQGFYSYMGTANWLCNKMPRYRVLSGTTRYYPVLPGTTATGCDLQESPESPAISSQL